MILGRLSITAFSLLVVASSFACADDGPEQKTPKPQVPEFARMLGSILAHGSDMGPYSGWFHPSESRYSWGWLATKYDSNKDGMIEPNEMKGLAPLFRALDRDGDGVIVKDDLDWLPSSKYLQARSQARARFSRMDPNGNGRVTLAEWEKAFEQAAKGKRFLTLEDLADYLYPPQRRPSLPKDGKPTPADGPSRWTLLKGLFSGEIGSRFEGPAIGQDAPEFTLETHDKVKRISLSEFRGKKPVVLIFGSFT